MSPKLVLILILALSPMNQIVEGAGSSTSGRSSRSKYKGPTDVFQDLRSKVWEFLRKNPCDAKVTWAQLADQQCDSVVKAFRRLPAEEQGKCQFATHGQCDLSKRTCNVIIPLVKLTIEPGASTDRLFNVIDESKYATYPLRMCVRSVAGFKEAIKVVKDERLRNGRECLCDLFGFRYDKEEVDGSRPNLSKPKNGKK